MFPLSEGVEKVFLTAKGAKCKRKGRKAKMLILNPLRTLRIPIAIGTLRSQRLMDFDFFYTPNIIMIKVQGQTMACPCSY
jgi:hypothetical protein